jgi:hypothetical protein
MDEVSSLTDRFTDSVNDLWDAVGGYLPKLVGALVLVVVALLVAKLAQAVVEKVLNLVGVDRLTKNTSVAKSLKTAEVNVDVVSVAGRISFWIVILVFALTIADVLELNAMSAVIHDLVAYLPNVLAAVVVLIVTIAGARLVRDVMAASLARMRVDFGSQVSAVAFYVLTVFGFVMAIDQLGFDTTVLTANLTVIVAGLVLALALAFGLGGREVAGQIVSGVYSNLKSTAKKR